jgi:hypothetical protein
MLKWIFFFFKKKNYNINSLFLSPFFLAVVHLKEQTSSPSDKTSAEYI